VSKTRRSTERPQGSGHFSLHSTTRCSLCPGLSQGRSDNGIAKVHGIIDGQYVAGDVRIKRIAKYHPRTGVWTGRGPVAEFPSTDAGPPTIPPDNTATFLPPRSSGASSQENLDRVPTRAVSHAVARALADALDPRGVGSGAVDPEENLDPQLALQRSITREIADSLVDAAPPRGELAAAKGGQKLLSAAAARTSAKGKATKTTVGGCACKSACDRKGKDRSWCKTVDGCGKGGRGWDYCEHEMITTVKGCKCKFPFEYRGEQHTSCLDSSRTFLWGPQPARGKGPRGVWCVTEGQDCGVGDLVAGSQVVKWDRCELPVPSDVGAVEARAAHGDQLRANVVRGAGSRAGSENGLCGATVGDERRKDLRPWSYDGECPLGQVCNYRCSKGFCETCAGGDCICLSKGRKGAQCGEATGRPPAYSGRECESGVCAFGCSGSDEACSVCDGGNCVCL
jgi:hypothetical protein